MVKTSKLFIVFLGISSMACAHDKELGELYEKKSPKETVSATLKPVVKMFGESLQVAAAKIEEYCSTVIDKAHELYRKAFVDVYKKTFTKEELEEILAFYRTKTGRKLAECQSAMEIEMAAAMQEFQIIARDVAESMQEKKENVKESVIVALEKITKKDAVETEEAILAKEIASHKGVMLVKFSTIWCGPCKVYAPIVEEVAATVASVKCGETAVPVRYIAVDGDLSPKVLAAYKVQAYPTTIIFKDGKEVDRFVGAQDKEALITKLQAAATK